MEAFSNWLLSQTHRWDPVGVLAREAKEDKTWPKEETFEPCLVYLKKNREQRILSFRINALIEAWSNYSIVMKCTPPIRNCKSCGAPLYPGISANDVNDEECDKCVDDGPSIFVVGKPIGLTDESTVCEACLTEDEKKLLGDDEVQVWREGTGGWVEQPPNCERCGRKLLVDVESENECTHHS